MLARFADRDMLMRYHVGLGIGHVGSNNGVLHSHVIGSDAGDNSDLEVVKNIDHQPHDLGPHSLESGDSDLGWHNPFEVDIEDQPTFDHHDDSSNDDEDDLDGSGSDDDYDTSHARDSDPGSEPFGSESEYDD